MNAETVIRKDKRGGYNIGFSNFQSLGKSQIKDIFSKYGRVTYISGTSNENGYRFVRLATFEEAQKAVSNAKLHNIKLRPHTIKHNGQSMQRENKSSDMHNNARANKQLTKPRIPVWQHEVDNASVCSASSTSSEDLLKWRRQQSFRDKAKSMTSLKMADQVITSKSAVADDKIKQRYFDLVNSKKHEITGDGEDDEEDSPDRKIVVDAAEVIVGNIHPKFGSAFVLELFEQHEPIAVTYTRLVPNRDIRYCHVYFQNVRDAKEVEHAFDGYNLLGMRLVVARPSKLMTLADRE